MPHFKSELLVKAAFVGTLAGELQNRKKVYL